MKRNSKNIHTKVPPLLNRLTNPSRILELGCGVGNDSLYFAEQGHIVTATDFSNVVIAQNSQKYMLPNLTFFMLDIAQPFPYNGHAFDVVYARLSLHYFADEVTKQIFTEIHRVLIPGGMLCFMCKSVKDSSYGEGKLIEKDMYDFNGHVRHFFSEEYARECLNGLFRDTSIVSEDEVLYGKQSADVKVIAYKEEQIR